MSRRRKLALGVAFVALVNVVLGSVLVATRPFVRARYHLRRASPGEVRLIDRADEIELSFEGHALAFERSGAAQSLLCELAAFAEDEALRDDVSCYRALLLGLEPLAGHDLSRDWHGRAESTGPRPLVAPRYALAVMVHSLEARDARLRRLTISHLPPDSRVLEAMVAHLFRLASHAKEASEEITLALAWFETFTLANQKLVQQEGRRGAWGHFPDRDWALAMGWEGVAPKGRGLAWSAAAFERWLVEYRARLPEQIR
jgi:hypothetical protein